MKIVNNMNEPSIGTWLTIYSEAIAEILCNSGYDWITVDLEHTPITLSQAEKLIRVIDLSGVKPFVRVSSNDEAEIKKVLDFGARGIIVPMINNVTDVKKAIASSFYPPEGKRGMGLYRAQGYGDQEKKMEYINSTSRDIELYVNIESKEAIENIDEIFDSDISGYFLGPYDLSASIGSPGKFETIEFIDMEKKILKAAEKYNVSKGIHVIEPNIESLNQKVSDGYNLIAFSVDFRMLETTARRPFQDD